MSARKKLDPSSAANQITTPTKNKPDAPEVDTPQSAAVNDFKKAPQKLRHETSVRFSPETRGAIKSILSFCSSVPELQHRIIQKTTFEIGLYVLSKLDDQAFKSACFKMPDLSTATGGAPLRIPMSFYTKVVIPLIDNYSKVLKSNKGANVSRLTIIGIHYLHSKLTGNDDEFAAMMIRACEDQYDEGLNIC